MRYQTALNSVCLLVELILLCRLSDVLNKVRDLVRAPGVEPGLKGSKPKWLPHAFHPVDWCPPTGEFRERMVQHAVGVGDNHAARFLETDNKDAATEI